MPESYSISLFDPALAKNTHTCRGSEHLNEQLSWKARAAFEPGRLPRCRCRQEAMIEENNYVYVC
jgi:hypothetical protein